MTVYVIPKRVQRVWDKSNIRGSVLASLCLQILLIFLAPSRKRTRGYFITIILWSAYLLADFVAAYAIGLISNNQGDECDKSNVNDALSAFWAPFLLLHLGGPDSITAFSLEDNELWIRHLFGLVAELIMIAYVFTQAIPFHFWLPTVLVLMVGVIKYAERTRALYLACLDSFSKGSMEGGHNQVSVEAQITPEGSKERGHNHVSDSKEAQTTPEGSMERGHNHVSDSEEAQTAPVEALEVVQHGFQFYKVFRKLIVDQMLSVDEKDKSKEFFSQLQALDAFRVMEVELNFMYDELFTKLATVHGSSLWYIFRFICNALIAASFILFKSHHKPHIHPLDIAITYSLLIAAIILEIVSLIKLVFSDWTVALLKLTKAVIPISKIHKFISFQGRWSNSMAQYNLISLCFKRRYKLWDKVTKFFGLNEIFEELMYRKFIPVEDDLKLFIFDKLKEKAREANDIYLEEEIYSSRGVMAVKKYTDLSNSALTVEEVRFKDGVSHILETVEEMKFEWSVLIWHIATDLLYYYKDTPDNSSRVDSKNHQNFSEILWDYTLHLRKKKSMTTDPEEAHSCRDHVDHKKLCKILSDYMLYLIILQPSLISIIPTTSRIRFQDTCEEFKKFKKFKEEVGSQEMNEILSKEMNKTEACKKLLFDGPGWTGFPLMMLARACDLARSLGKFNEVKMWEMMSEVWLELLCYGASHSRGHVHAQQLSKGGELVTFVWLLTAHFGLRDEFEFQPMNKLGIH